AAPLRDGGFRRLLSMTPNIARACEDTPSTTPAPQCRGAGVDFKHAIREADGAQLMLSVAVEARRTLIGSTTTFAPPRTRLQRSTTSWWTRGMQPDDAGPRRVDGSLVRGMR